MTVSQRQPKKRGLTILRIAHLRAYKRDDERIAALRLGLDEYSNRFLERLRRPTA